MTRDENQLQQRSAAAAAAAAEDEDEDEAEDDVSALRVNLSECPCPGTSRATCPPAGWVALRVRSVTRGFGAVATELRPSCRTSLPRDEGPA
jgi:hypothetical protein